jgi:hypothetical protein
VDVDPVGHLPHVRHVVGDEDHGEPAVVPDAADQVQHLPGLLHAERGGGLVHDHHVAGEGGAARHRDTLPLSARQRFDWLLHGRNVDPQRLEMRGRLGQHSLVVD